MKSAHPQSQWWPGLSSAHLPYRGWLLDRGSLTRRIQRRCREFSVRPVRQEWATPCGDELSMLGLRYGELALVREVFLYCGETPVVFAHSVLVREHLRGEWHSLAGLGSRPLGAALFANPVIRRAPLRFRQLDRHHALYRRACRVLTAPPGHLWARRSLFRLRGKPILVTEVFLPDILDLGL